MKKITQLLHKSLIAYHIDFFKSLFTELCQNYDYVTPILLFFYYIIPNISHDNVNSNETYLQKLKFNNRTTYKMYVYVFFSNFLLTCKK